MLVHFFLHFEESVLLKIKMKPTIGDALTAAPPPSSYPGKFQRGGILLVASRPLGLRRHCILSTRLSLRLLVVFSTELERRRT
ncbi:hypothetical protein Bca101_019820 [Brassica carinata]